MQAPFARHRLANGNAGLIDKTPQNVCCLRVDNTTASNDKRSFTGTYPRGRLLQDTPIWPIAWNAPDTPGEKGFWICIRLRLDILGKSQCDSTSLRWTRQYTHGFWKSSQHLFWPCDAIPVAAHRLEAIVDRYILAVFKFELL